MSPEKWQPTPGTTRKRNIRVGDLWDQVEELAKPEKMTDVVKRLLAAELRRLQRKAAAGQGPEFDDARTRTWLSR